MTAMWQTGEISIDTLIRHVNESTIGLPQFQRLSVWGKSDWTPFVKTILLGRPTGSLLLLEAGRDSRNFSPRPIDGGPALGAQGLKYLLLDGQQRTTTIYKIFVTGFSGQTGPKKEFVLDVAAALERGELQESDLELVSTSRVGPPSKLAQKGRVSVRTLFDDAQRAVWLNSYVSKIDPKNIEAGLVRLVSALAEVIPAFGDLKSYKFPVLEVSSSAPLDVIVDIFEGMNRRGQKLNQFDLMVARLYKPSGRSGYFDLRSEFDEALKKCPKLATLGVGEDDGMLPLQLIALQLSRLPDGLRPIGVKGLNNRDVLEIPPDQIIGKTVKSQLIPNLGLAQAMEALESAAEFLFDHCGVVSSKLLPQQSMLLPLADQFLLGRKRLSDDQLKKWFFSVGLSIDYYGSVNSYAARDCKALRDWANDDKSRLPHPVAQLTKATVADMDLSQPMSREGAILGTTLMALLVAHGAMDWRKGQLAVKNSNQPVEFHHMVPENRLKTFIRSKDDRKPIANFAPLEAKTNRELRDQIPMVVRKDLGADADPILTSHYVDPALLSKAHGSRTAFDKMLAAREASLKKFIVNALSL